MSNGVGVNDMEGREGTAVSMWNRLKVYTPFFIIDCVMIYTYSESTEEETAPHTSLHCTPPHTHLTSSYLTTPHHTSPHLTTLYSTTPHYTVLHHTSPHLTTPHYIVLHLTTPHLITSHHTSLHQIFILSECLTTSLMTVSMATRCLSLVAR